MSAINVPEIVKKHQPRLEERRKRLEKFWSGGDIGRPPISFIPGNLSPRQIYDDETKQLDCMAKYFQAVLAFPGDTIPIFWPDMGTVSLASTFGGTIIREGTGEKQWIKPVLSSLEEVVYLEPSKPISNLVKKEFDRCCRWRDITKGLSCVAPPDMQGPVNIACMLIDTSELLVGMYTCPELVHRLLRTCTDLILKVLESYKIEFGKAFAPITWPLVWFPCGYGLTLTQDSIPFLSPNLYREFELPYVQEISRAMGGVYMHCCGRLEHVLGEVKKVDNLRGIDHAYPESHLEKILQNLGNHITVTSNIASRGEKDFSTYDLYVQYLLPRLPKGTRMWHILPADQPEITIKTLNILGLSEVCEEYQAALKVR
ncbi:MAG: hypothetical protein V2A65_02625 [Candidatus Omnitrophota bacterium]